MFQKFSSLIFLSCLIFFACSKKISTTNAGNKNTTDVMKPAPTPVSNLKPSTTGKSTMPSDIEQNVVAMLKRTPCFGKCPSYELKVFDNGTATYTGFAFVEKIGKFEAHVSNDFISRLQQEAAKSAFNAFSEKYPVDGSTLTDIPSTISYVRMGKKGNRVANNYDAPKELMMFENWLENEIQNMEWKKLDTGR